MIDPTGLAADGHRCFHSNHFLAEQPANHLIIFWLKMKKSNSFHWFCEYNFKVITSNECQLCYFDGTLTMNEPTNNERNEERKRNEMCSSHRSVNRFYIKCYVHLVGNRDELSSWSHRTTRAYACGLFTDLSWRWITRQPNEGMKKMQLYFIQNNASVKNCRWRFGLLAV